MISLLKEKERGKFGNKSVKINKNTGDCLEA